MPDETPDPQTPSPDRDKKIVDDVKKQVEALAGGDETILPDVSPPRSGPPRDGPLPDSIPGYEILREIHRGGQGIVYQAIQKGTKRKVAIKVLLEGSYAGDSARRRFEREIELIAQLKHPNIVEVFHAGEDAAGRQFCVMDYVRGLPLDLYAREKKLPIEDALRLFAKVCDAVSYAHQRGVIHRDLKPSNILVDSEGQPKVLDFGLAKQLTSSQDTIVSITGQVVGTLPYLSPEQARGNPDEIDIRTDVYSLGVILYELLTGQYPYPVVGQIADVLRHIAETQPTPPSRAWKADSGVRRGSSKRSGSFHLVPFWLRARELSSSPIDDEVQTMVLRSLAKERDRRYASAGDLARDIHRYLAGDQIEAKRDSNFYMLRKSLKRYRGPLAVGTVLAIGAGVLVVMGVAHRAESGAYKRRSQADAKLQLAYVLINQRSQLGEARELIDDVLHDFADDERAYLLRGTLTAIEALNGRIEDKQETTKKAIDDFHRAHLAAGGQLVWDAPPGALLTRGNGLGSAPALKKMADLILLNDKDRSADQNRTVVDTLMGLLSQAEEIETQTPGVRSLNDYLPPIYDRAKDELICTPPADSPEVARTEPDLNAEIIWIVPDFGKLTMWYVQDLICDRLFFVDDTGKCRLNSLLVQSCKPASDFRVWIVELSRDARMQDGRPLTAQDVEWSFNNHFENWPLNLATVKTTGERSLQFTFHDPMSSAPSYLMFPIHRRGDESICSGPFSIERVDAEELSLIRWDGYPGDKSYVRRIIFRAESDRSKRLQLLRLSECDVLELKADEFRWHVNGESFNNRIIKSMCNKSNYDYIVWNQGKKIPYFADSRVRHALAHAVDLDSMRRSLFDNIYSPCRSIFEGREFSLGDNAANGFKYDPGAAERLLDQAGWHRSPAGDKVRSRNGIELRFELLVPDVRATPPAVHLAAAQIVEQLSRIGAGVTIKAVPWSDALKKQEDKQFDAYFGSVISSLDPSDEWVRWTSSGSKNYGSYDNPQIAGLFRQAWAMPEAKTGKSYRALSRIIYNDQPYLFLWQKPALWAFSKRVRGIELGRGFGPVRFQPGPRAWWVELKKDRAD